MEVFSFVHFDFSVLNSSLMSSFGILLVEGTGNSAVFQSWANSFYVSDYF